MIDDTACVTQYIDSDTSAAKATDHTKYQQLSSIFPPSNAVNISDLENNRSNNRKYVIQPNYSRISDSSTLCEKMTNIQNIMKGFDSVIRVMGSVGSMTVDSVFSASAGMRLKLLKQ